MTATEAREELKAGRIVRITCKPADGTLCKLRKRRSKQGEYDVYTKTLKGRWEKAWPFEHFLSRFSLFTFEKVKESR